VADVAWGETTITWANSSAIAGFIGSELATVTVNSETGQYWEWDVTAYVQAQKDRGSHRRELCGQVKHAVRQRPNGVQRG
jgi:hypothetical protein